MARLRAETHNHLEKLVVIKDATDAGKDAAHAEATQCLRLQLRTHLRVAELLEQLLGNGSRRYAAYGLASG